MNSLFDRLQNWMPLVMLLMLLAATYWLNEQVKPLTSIEDPHKRHDVDYVIDNITSITLNAQGQHRFLLSAESMWHYPDDDTTHLKQPRLTNLYSNRPPLNFSSDSAKLSHNGDEVYMYDNVMVVRPASSTHSETIFTTNFLHVVPDLERADTDRLVMVKDAYDTIHGVGMELDNRAMTLKLLAQVRSTHEQNINPL
jgi:lipopolysaccharide export system protein LptC